MEKESNREKKHRVAGTCFTGTIQFPGTGFAWINRR